MIETRYIKKYEIECKCGCGTNNVSQSLIDMLTAVRVITDRAIKFNSVCRCRMHNANEGGKDGSSHISENGIIVGKAADIACTTNTYRFALIQALLAVGFKRILVYKRFIHVIHNRPNFSNLQF